MTKLLWQCNKIDGPYMGLLLRAPLKKRRDFRGILGYNRTKGDDFISPRNQSGWRRNGAKTQEPKKKKSTGRRSDKTRSEIVRTTNSEKVKEINESRPTPLEMRLRARTEHVQTRLANVVQMWDFGKQMQGGQSRLQCCRTSLRPPLESQM